MNTGYTLDELQALTYTPEQQAVIADAAEQIRNNQLHFLEYEFSERFATAHRKTWAIFGRHAYELLAFKSITDDDGTHFDYVPLLLDGRMVQECPDEGEGGIAYLMRCTNFKGRPRPDAEWTATYIPSGWLYTEELAQSMDQIWETIGGEIARGTHVFTRNRPGEF